MSFFHERSPVDRIKAQIAESKEIPDLSRKPELLGKEVCWPTNHGHGPKPTEACDRNVAVVTSVSIADKYCLWAPLGAVLVGIQCAGCAEPTTVVEERLEYLPNAA